MDKQLLKAAETARAALKQEGISAVVTACTTHRNTTVRAVRCMIDARGNNASGATRIEQRARRALRSISEDLIIESWGNTDELDLD